MIVGGIPKGKDFGIILEHKNEEEMRHFQVTQLFWSMPITCSEKTRLRGDDRTLWKNRSGMCCSVSPLCLAKGKHSDAVRDI